MTAVDGFAITMLGIILLTLGMLLWMLFWMVRGQKKKSADEKAVEELLAEVAEMEDEHCEASHSPRQPKKQPAPGSQPWEKDPNWWRDQS